MNSCLYSIPHRKKSISAIRNSIIILFLFSLTPIRAHAHPHVFIKSSTQFVWNDTGKLQGAYLVWDFDRFFSADIIKWLDTDHDGTFNDAENTEVYNHAFINLKHYYYYTFIRQGASRTNPPGVSQFKATQKDGIMTYRFYIDLSSYTGKDLYLAVYDYTFFTDVEYPDKSVTFSCPDTLHPSYEITENKQHPVYYDPLSPATDTRVYYKWAPGLQTYYPREIHLTW